LSGNAVKRYRCPCCPENREKNVELQNHVLMKHPSGSMVERMNHICPINRCEGTLVVEEVLHQDGTGEQAVKVRCIRNPRHRYFLVAGRPPSKYNRLGDDTRWKK
jgi:hypothetical protein